MKIAALQMVSTPRVDENLDQAHALARAAAGSGAELLLPEYFCLMGHHERDKLRHAEPPGDGPIQFALASLARDLGVWLIGGTVPLRVPDRDDRVHNSCLVFDPQGRCVARYDKIHLFRFDDGVRAYDEAATLQAGQTPCCVEVVARDGGRWRVGLSICYDLRFPELYRAMMDPPCDLLVVPAAFTHATGQAHWELLLRARAVENQAYVLAAGQGGQHENGRRTWGHSMAIDPWGEVLEQQAEGAGVVGTRLQAARLQQVRTQLPALAHRVLGRACGG